VVRDLFRSETQPEQSYSERQLYEAALDRLSREISAVERITETEAVKQIEAALAKGPRRGPKGAEGAEDTGPEEGEATEGEEPGDSLVENEAA
jgi:CarD family transcriptional regulator